MAGTILVLEDTLQRLKRTRTDCSTCIDRTTNDVTKMQCHKFGRADVPLEVANVGCEHWTDDEIPF